MDAYDRNILSHLQQNGRASNVELAEDVGLSPSPCLRRVRELERRGVIRQYAALLDASAVGLGVSVLAEVRLERQTEALLDDFEAHIRARPEVVECYLMTGDHDYMLRIVVPDLEAYRTFVLDHLSKAPGVSNIRSSFALKQVKYSTALPLDQLADGG
ncbi:MAG: ArsR family transcriptional regulator [Rhodospirillaceae bacterium]|nr:ArsR family transcriptional regulator [Rhodospirillaceae bacterium]|tara:strand:+ start:954 stop:1427 length:474 start_codon:yes stop_codon:yes gene_type:complete